MAPSKRTSAMQGFEPTPKGIALTLLDFVSTVKREIAAVAGLLLLATAAIVVYDLARGEAPAPLFRPVAVALTDEGLEAWTQTTAVLAGAKVEGKLAIPARSLADLLSWMRSSPDALKAAAPDADPATYVGITLSIHSARNRERELFEYDKMAKAEDEAYKRSMSAGVEYRPIPVPTLSEAEWSDLRAYEARWGPIEGALLSLIPTLEPPVPYSDSKEVAAAPTEGGSGAPPTALRWRVVNPSRYGPRVLRTR